MRPTLLVVASVIVAFLATGRSAEAQPAQNIPRIGVLSGALPESPRLNALRDGLRDFGYVDGQNIAIEWRLAGGRAERFPELAAELVRSNVQVIIASDNPAIEAARAATGTIPIVMVVATDPVNTGFVASLGRPGGNVTGLTFQATELQGKAVQLIKEALPNAARLVILWDPAEPGRRAQAREAELAARALGLTATLVGAGGRAELDSVFAVMVRGRPDAVLVQSSQTNFEYRARIAELAAKRLLPTMGWSADTVEAGLLMSYGPSIVGLYRRAAYYVDKILKGAKPADLPVEQPTKFELVINLKTAKALGLAIPQAVLLRADQVIE